MDEHADGAHLGMTVQMEHTTCKDPLTDEAAVVSEFGLYTPSVYLNCMFACLYKYIVPHMQVQLTCTYMI